MASKKKLLQAAAGSAGGAGLDVDEVFSTFLYDGTGSAQTITNGIDLSGEGGLVWLKDRVSTEGHFLYDTARGATKRLFSHNTNAEATESQGLTSFNSNGFTNGANGNANGQDYVSWTFRKAPKFFDVVTYTGDGQSSKTISHSLDTTVGMMIVKCVSNTGIWWVYHKDIGATKILKLQANSAEETYSGAFNDTAPTSTQFTVGNDSEVNFSGRTYVAYLFAHNNNDGEFGPDSDQDIIKCGSYSTNSSAKASINLGFEPQWIIYRPANDTADWKIIDNIRGFMGSTPVSGAYNKAVSANQSFAEYDEDGIHITSTGFEHVSGFANKNIIYMAIRRGPLAAPTDATKVFGIDTLDSTAPGFDSNFVVDMAFERNVSGESDARIASRLTGETALRTNTTGAEIAAASNSWDYMDGWFYDLSSNSSKYSWMWKRAPSYFDVVAYTGTGSARTISHNLGVKPEMIWIKDRSSSNGFDWMVYHSGIGATKFLRLNTTHAETTSNNRWNDTEPAANVFTVGDSNRLNLSGEDYIAYLFATVAGVSKVGSYTGTGSDQNIDCGFSSGARFVLIKCTNTGGTNWMVFDSVRGIVSGSEPHLRLNSTNAESSDDQIDPYSGGFALTGNDNDTNGSSKTYIFYAIA